MKKIVPVLCLLAFFTFSCNNNKPNEATDNSPAILPPTVMNYQVLKILPHDTSSFTEGLFLHDGAFYESTGMETKSFLRKNNIETGKAIQQTKLGNEYFGEGISMINNKIYQLTYKEHKVFVYDMNFKKIQELYWPYEGWGMTTDGKQLIISTGGSNIYFVNPETFKIERTLGVINNNGYVDSINELEYVDGYIYSNVWYSNYINKINIKTGLVEARADLTDIFKKTGLPSEFDDQKGSVLNGIAYNPETKSFYITGKYWSKIFEIRFN
jgi:glutamine cyclotransferase